MAKAKKTELATTEDAHEIELAERAALAELSDFFDTVEVTGMEDVGGDDIKIASKIWNMGGVDKNKQAYPKNVFFDTLTEKVQDEIDAILLSMTKTFKYDEFDNALDKTIVHCESKDMITGTESNGNKRPCEGCPDTGWFNDSEGKPFRKCGEVQTVVGIERITQRPFITRFKKTGLRPWRNYLMAHHYGARVGKDGRADIPLFAFDCRLSLAMHESGKYALPVLERGESFLPEAELRAAYQAALQYKSMMEDVMKVADKSEAKHSSKSGADNMNADDFGDD